MKQIKIIQDMNNNILFKRLLSILIILLINLNAQSYAQTEPTNINEYTDTIQIVNNPSPSDFVFTENNELELDPIMLADQLGGIAPLDIVYVSSVNSYYIYGYHRIAVVDGTTHQLLESIDISNYGTTDPYAVTDLIRADARRLAFNPNNNELYCITEDRNFIVIDVLTNEVLDSETTNLGNPNTVNGKYLWTFIHYDERTSKVFVIIVNSQNMNEETAYFVFDAVSHAKLCGHYFAGHLRGFAVNQNRDRVYFAIQNKFQVWDIYASNMIGEIVSDRTMGNILYINDNANSIHKAICFPFDDDNLPNPYACVLNGENDNSSTFSLDYNQILDSEYNPTMNTIYYSFKSPSYGVKVITAGGYNNIATMNMSNSTMVADLIYNGNNKVIGGKCSDAARILTGNGGVIIDCGTNNYTEVEEIPNTFNYKNAVNSNTNETAMINFLDGSVSFFDNIGNYTETIDLGGSAKLGIYNEVENKVYTYNRYIGKIYINDLDNNQSTVIDIGVFGVNENISGMVYDKDKNLIYLSVFTDSDKIKIIDGQTDQLLTTEIDLTYGHCNGIFYGGNDKLYCAIGLSPNVAIEIIDLNTLNVLATTSIWPTVTHTYYNTWFDLTRDNDIIVCVNDIGANLGGIEIIDKDLNNVLNYYVVPAPWRVAYNPVNNKVYTGNYVQGFGTTKNITILDLNNGNDHTMSTLYYVKALEYCDKQNYLAVFGIYYVGTDAMPIITNIDGQSDEINSTMSLDYFASGIKYNPINGNLYALVAINQSADQKMEYWNLNNFYGIGSIVQSTMQERNWVSSYIVSNEKNIILNTQDNQLIVPTGYHSRLNVVQCEDEKQMLTAYGYNWLSYPKLERDHIINEPYNTRSLLENLDPLPDNLTMEGKSGQYSVFFTKEGSVWIEDYIPTVQSTRGYKLSTSNSGTTWLPLTGTRMDPDYPIDVFEGYENWVGYFLLQQQSPLDAFADLLPDMTSAKGHDWTMVQFGTPNGGDPVWVLQPQDAQLRYGDMAIVEVNTNRSFQWNMFGMPSEEILQMPEQFSYTELPDYAPIFIEPDPANQPLEIGAFVNDTCIGACVVNPADTLVLLRGYMIGDPGDSVVFENYYGTKSSMPNRVSDYYVFNQDNKLREKRTIKIGENKLFHLVSFNKPDEQSGLIAELQLDVHPNPMHNNASISFVLPTENNVKIEVMDQLGRNVNILEQGILFAGFHSFNWDVNNHDGDKLKPGVYIIRLTAGSASAHRKIIVN